MLQKSPPPVGQGLLAVEYSWSHSVGLLWKSDQSEAETYTWQHTTLTKDRQPYPLPDSNPHHNSSKQAPADQRIRTRAATLIGTPAAATEL